VEIMLTAVELDAVRRFATANDLTLADTFRLGVLHLAALLDEDGDPPLVLGSTVVLVEKPLAELLPGLKKRRVRH
jgi:hypothetical protein